MGSDEAEVEQLEALRRLLLRRATYLTRSFHDAEDLVQSTFERLLELKGASLSAHELTPLSQTIVKRLAIDRARKASRWQLTELADDHNKPLAASSGETEPWQRVSAEQLTAALQCCSPLDRQAFELHYGQGLRYVDIAAQLGIAMGTVATRLHRARAQLQKVLTKLLADDQH